MEFSFIKEIEKSPVLVGKYQIKSFKKGDILLSTDDPLDSLLIIKRGKLKTYSLAENGVKCLMRIYEADGLLGEVELLTKELVIYFVEAIDDGEVYVIKQDDFLQWMQHDFHVAWAIMQQLADKLINTGAKMRSVLHYPLRYQVVLSIWKYTNHYPHQRIKKELIVEELGSNIRSINRILKQLGEEGIISNLKGEVEVVDSELLVELMHHYEAELGKN